MKRSVLMGSVALGVGLGTALLWKARGAGAIFVVSLAIAAALRPLVDRLEAHRIGRAAALGIVYLAGLALFSLAIYFAAPRVLGEVATAADLAPAAYERLRAWAAGGGAGHPHAHAALLRQLVAALPPAAALADTVSAARLDAVAGQLLGAALDLVDAVGACLIVFALSAYWSAGRESFERLWMSLVPARRRARARDLGRGVVSAVGAHLRGQLAASAATSVLLLVGFSLMRLPTPVVPALAGALSRWIPFVGPIGAVAVALVVGGLVGPALGVGAAVYTALALVATARWHGGLGLLWRSPSARQRRPRPPSPTLVVLLAIALGDAWGLVGLVVAAPAAVAFEALLERVIATRTRRSHRPRTIADLEARLSAVRQQLLVASAAGAPQLGNVLGRLDRLVARARSLDDGGATINAQGRIDT